MRRGFRSSRQRSVPIWTLCLSGPILAIMIFELYRWIVPFHTANPLWHEVTIGEPVIDAWQYGGKDEAGYLKFYLPGSSPVVLPPNSHMFDADGKFVVIEGATPSTLTFAQPYEAISLPWLIGGLFTLLALFAGVIAVWGRRRPKLLRGVPNSKRPRIVVARFKVPSRVRHWINRM